MRRSLQSTHNTSLLIKKRTTWFLFLVFTAFLGIIIRLFFWQVIKHQELETIAQNQYQKTIKQVGKRGQIFFAGGEPLATNKESYRLFAQPPMIEKEKITELVQKISSILPEPDVNKSKKDLEKELFQKLTKPKIKWVSLYQPIDALKKAQVETWQENGLGFDTYYERFYPEGSMAAHLVGFVGKNSQGEDTGYFGLEGHLQQELKPRSAFGQITTDAKGGLIDQENLNQVALDGRDFTLSIERKIQFAIEKNLQLGMNKYQAKSGEIVVINPKTGKILGMTTLPNFDPNYFRNYPEENFKNPSLNSLYEPGSTFKILTVAAGIDSGVITPQTVCTRCDGPRKFGRFTIKTWNEEYHPNITMTEALAKSDNVAMIFISELLGPKVFRDYLKKFGIGKAIGIELQGDGDTPIKETYVPVELATASFGQGIFTTSLQLVQAVGAIANRGELMQLQILNSVYDPITQTKIQIAPKSLNQAIKQETASQLKAMMVESAQYGEAQWTYSKDHTVAGKTGTSQVANQDGYDKTQTIASFIGFAPVDEPQFLMLVKLVAPQSSPWAAETAAPLWYQTAQDLYLLLNIPPDKT